ncbi:MAG: RagB/SusD family nutrient uptake outer membrane protein [Bacteroidota bacterium]
MKKILLTLFIGLLILSCDIERDPYDQIAVDTLFESEGALQTATLGNYAMLKTNPGNSDYTFEGWGDRIHRLAEYPGDNVTWSKNSSDHYYKMYDYRAVTTNYRVESFWDASYKVIVGCNVVLEAAEEGVSDVLDQLIGENYYLRALVYFQMGNVFGRPFNQGTSNLSVPLKLTSSVDDTPKRSTVGEVYDQVISDLLMAEMLMNEEKSAAFATKEAAQALLSRVYLYMEDNENAELYADKVINSGRYQLLSTEDFEKMNTINPNVNQEAIFSITLNTDADLSGEWDHYWTVGSLYASIDGKGWGEMFASSSYLDLLNQNENDARKGFIEPQYEDEGNQWVYWVDNDYSYQTRLTSESGDVTTFEDNGFTYTVEEETVDGKKRYFFMDGGSKQYVDKGYEMETMNESGQPKWYILKASLQDDNVHLWSPMVSRLAEMHLNKAESLAKRGMDQQAIDQVNIIRERAGIPTYSLATIPVGKSVLDIVLEERRLEFAFEGHRKFDVFRNGETMDRRYPGGHLWGANPFYEIQATHNRIVEFLPERQVNLQGLIQNP